MVLLLPLLLAACADRNTASDRQARYGAMVGHSEAELLQALGPPTRRESLDGHEFLIYEGSDIWPGRGGGPWARLVGPGRHAFAAATFDCRATFAVVDGVVNADRLRGNGC